MSILSVALAAGVAASPAPVADYAAWSRANTDGSWTRITETAVEGSRLPDLVPEDAARFCPGYAALDRAGRVRFWTMLLSAVAKPESNFDPQVRFEEPEILDSNNQRVVSRGLLQLSIESANQRAYQCGISNADALHDPATNLACGVRILERWVARDGVIAGRRDNRWLGGGRYWSTLRDSSRHMEGIVTSVRGSAACPPAA